MDTLEILHKLVAFDTTSRRSNLDLVHWAADYLENAGARVRLTSDASGEKANILATIGPDAPGGLVLSGHTDVVPVDDQDWESDPFALASRDGRLHGRGAVDMKGFVAACLAAVPDWRARELRRPIHLALSYDEEVGCLGVPLLIADMLAHCPLPALAIIGEPTQMRIGLSHRGFYGYCSVFHGRAAHSSDPRLGTSAIEPAAAFVATLASFGKAECGERSGTTVNIGKIAGGSAINIVPERCEVIWEFRPPDEAGAGAVLAEVESLIAGLSRGVGVETTPLARVLPLDCAANSPAVAVAHKLGGLWPPIAMPFGTEAGFFQQAGIPALVCGPGSIAQAHQANEWIAGVELEAADRFLVRVGDWAAAEL
ncbi:MULTISPECIES: acetylornithine deacetylase [unclassified Bosea (in: a-proteobacteria)]|uniref:acetylornithine deacetylase n=1 Tax=unclassified Bosea (in: a-proteobacteria) TaxID=2653178 RepID=UPI000F760494|nr:MULTISPECIES: acetylornithine deacetylase [unclassified Bosea (in: a-proteobacteria)]AZO81059.1 acetylornithine deacetylase (ArgE) [Bosea sp. Tri-49]RXT26026.1 acetylornithine deacetylase [Bosea sp. Tri-39]RXT31268.1 acetylornithine deacetylase [Bosea sp. Tri-54]